MKQGWEYKKWNEVLTIINGKNQSAVEDTNGEFPIYGSGGIMGYANNWLCPENCVIIGRKGNINKPIFVKTKFWNVDTAFGLNANKEYLLPKYLFYFCLDYNFERHNKAVTIPSLTKADLLKIQIPLPPKPTQLSIVSELDKINELIRLKKEQLKDYDNLAQSIFYEMFGDPVENDKGWEVKKLGEVCDIFAGGDKPKDIKTTKDNEYIYPVIANGEGKKGILGYSKKCRVIKNAVTIGARGASIGNCRIVKDGFTPAIRLLTLIPSEKLDCPFLFYIVKGLDYKQNGAGQAQLTVPNIKNERIILPPFPLQHLFAQRIEQIERQKSAVQKSITDLEALLASRMQHWFE